MGGTLTVSSIRPFILPSSGLIRAFAQILPRDQGCPAGSYTAGHGVGRPPPFLGVPEAEWVCANGLCFAIFDSYPVSPGHVLVITRRVVATFFECTAAEQGALMELVGEVKALLDERLDPRPDGYNVGFNAGAAAGQTVPHVHVQVIPRYTGDMGDPRGGVRHVITEKGTYLAGSYRPPWPRVAEQLPGASEIDLLASFVQPLGLDNTGTTARSAVRGRFRPRGPAGPGLPEAW